MANNQQDSSDEDLKPGKDLKTYIENRVELFSISIAEQVASAASASIQKFVGILFLSIGGVFLWIALGFYLGELLDSQSLGFLLAGLPLVLLGVIFYKRHSRNIEAKIQAEIIQRVTNPLNPSAHKKSSNKEDTTTDKLKSDRSE